MTIKIVFEPKTGKLFGAQLVGYDGVDKRADMLATVIKNNGTIYDLMEIEHAYAPPYSSAKDPVNMAGFVADNILSDKMKVAYWREVQNCDPDTFLLDVRTKAENQLGTIPGSVNIPVDELRKHLNELPTDKKIIIFCAVGLRGYIASRILTQNGFSNVYNLSGGYKTYETAIQKQSNEDIYDNISIAQDDVLYQKTFKSVEMNTPKVVKEIDACGLQCPGPIMQLKKAFEGVEPGEQIKIMATDPAFERDVKSWCNLTGNNLLWVENRQGTIVAMAEKTGAVQGNRVISQGNNKTIIVFSDDLDRALASFVIANGAASTGKKVTMFFTFWGLNVIKKVHKPAVKKDIFGKMFGMMLSSSSKKLALSKMNMFGIGPVMMRFIMKSKKIDSLEAMIQQAIENNIEMIACTMSMDVMGVKQGELLDTATLGGVATYLERAEDANLNLFI